MSRQRLFRTTFVLSLFALSAFGITLIALGTKSREGFWREFAIGAGIGIGPAALVALLFRVFLVDDVKREVIDPVSTEVRRALEHQMKEQVHVLIAKYEESIDAFRKLRQGGLLTSYKDRRQALAEFVPRVEEALSVEQTLEVIIVGSSLRGLLENQELESLLQHQPDRFKFVLTHPVVADLRARQENRRFQDIGNEIVLSLERLHELGVPPENVHLYKGAPTCFGIKAGNYMLLNPYPYEAEAMNSPCIVVLQDEAGMGGYFYDAFDDHHFGVLHSAMTEKLQDLDSCVKLLAQQLGKYADKAKELIEI